MAARKVKEIWIVWRRESHIYCGDVRTTVETDECVYESEHLAQKAAKEAETHGGCRCIVRRYPAPRSFYFL